MIPTEKISKNLRKYNCELCDYSCFKQSEYNKHLSTRKHQILQSPISKVLTYYCKHCDYGTDKKSSFNNHNGSIKHLAMVSNRSKLCSEFICVKCTKIYKDNSGLWRHKKKCMSVNNSNNIIKDHIEIHMEEYNDDHNDDHNDAKIAINTNDKDDIIMMLIKQNSALIKEQSNLNKEQSDIKQIILEIVKNGTNNRGLPPHQLTQQGI